MPNDLKPTEASFFLPIPTGLRAAQTTDMQTHPVVDLGFSEGGFCYSIVHKAHAKKFATTPTFGKTMPIFDCLERDFLLYLSINPFLIKIYAKAC